MSLRYSIDSFITKQVLDKSYRTHAKPFETEKWWGEYHKKYDFRTVQTVLEAFEKKRTEHFELVHRSDYRDTYRSRGLAIDVYLKHYRVYDAKYSKTTIIKRNILRRTLAKKSFALTFQLQKLAIPTIESLFYAGDRKGYICHEGIYVSIAEPATVPLSYYFEKISGTEKTNDFTEAFDEKITLFPIEKILESYRELAGRLLEKGIRGSHRELFGNTLIQFGKKDFKLLLCDQDVIDAISPYSIKEKRKELEIIDNYLQKRLETLKISYNPVIFEKNNVEENGENI